MRPARLQGYNANQGGPVVVKVIVWKQISERKKKKSPAIISGEMFIFRRRLPISPRSPSKILGSHESSVSLPCHRGASQLKDSVYCFWRKPAARSRFLPPLSFWSAISVYLSAGFFFFFIPAFPFFTLEDTQIECALTPFVWNQHQMPCAALSS